MPAIKVFKRNPPVPDFDVRSTRFQAGGCRVLTPRTFRITDLAYRHERQLPILLRGLRLCRTSYTADFLYYISFLRKCQRIEIKNKRKVFLKSRKSL